MRDFKHFVPEFDSKFLTRLNRTTTYEMIVEALYHMKRLFNINSLIVARKDEVLAFGKLCKEWNIQRNGLEIVNSNGSKAFKDLDTTKKLTKEYYEMQANYDEHSNKFFTLFELKENMDEFYDLTRNQSKYIGDKEVALKNRQEILVAKNNVLSMANKALAKV